MSKAPAGILPEDYLSKRVARRTNLVCLSLFGLVMTGLVMAFFVHGRQWQEVENAQRKINQDYQEADAKIERLAQYNKQKEVMERKARVTAALNERVPRTRIFSDLINQAPAHVSWESFELNTTVVREVEHPKTAIQRAQQKKKAADQKSKEKQDPLEIKIPKTVVNIKLVGISNTDTDVSDYMQALRENALFDDVKLIFTESTVVNDAEMRKFQLEMKVNQQVDLSEVDPVRAESLGQDPMSDELHMRNGKVKSGDSGLVDLLKRNLIH